MLWAPLKNVVNGMFFVEYGFWKARFWGCWDETFELDEQLETGKTLRYLQLLNS